MSLGLILILVIPIFPSPHYHMNGASIICHLLTHLRELSCKHLVGHSYLLALYELISDIYVKLAVKHIADVEKHNNLLSVDIVIIPYRQEVVKEEIMKF